MATISPQTRTGRRQSTDTIRPGPRIVRGHDQSTQMAASMNCQRQGTQTVRSQSAVTYADRSRTQTVCVREQSAIMFSPRKWARPRTAPVCDQARTRTVREQATATSVNYPQTVRSRGRAVRVNRSSILGRRSPRQSLARPVTLLRSKLTRRPAPGVASRISRTKNCSRHYLSMVSLPRTLMQWPRRIQPG